MSVMVYVCLYSLSLLSLSVLPFAKGAASFTQSPQNQSVQVGKTVELVWNYTVDNRNTDFGLISPIWDYYSSVYANWTEIAREDIRQGWNFTVTLATFPPGLRYRVSKKSVATLVINNVQLTDSGIYRCSLMLTGGSLPKVAHLSITPETTTTTTTPPPPSSSTTTPTSLPSPTGLSGGEIAGIVIGAVIGVLVIIAIIVVVIKKSKKSHEDPTDKKKDTEMNSPPAANA